MSMMNDGYKFDKDFDLDITMEEIEAVDKLLSRNIFHDGVLIAETTKEVVEAYPEVMGMSFEDAAVEFILSKSKDRTILSGIEEFVAETGDTDYAEHIGFLIADRYYEKVARKEPWSEILKRENEEN